MLRISLIYGAIAGTITIAFMVLGFALGEASELFGYLSMIVALSLVFIGIKRCRDVERGGVIKSCRPSSSGCRSRPSRVSLT